ncbi:hypothetical protein MMC25_004805 [Agyrium rufum]|nr:hypothetical protein [Agyrium rufum]
MYDFVYSAPAAHVIFGKGTIHQLPAEISRQNLKAPLILSTPSQVFHAENLVKVLNGKVAGTFNEAAMHTPSHITEKAVDYAKAQGADSVISIGGGSTIGLGKAISLRTGIPHICVPTTYAGSEMTPILGELKDGVKKTINDPRVLPGTVLYDVDLTMSLPSELTSYSGVNAIAHAVESLYNRDTNPVTTMYAREAIRNLATALPELVDNPMSETARSNALYGAWLCSACLANGGVALQHKLAHTVGGSCKMPHAETHTILLPHSIAYNSPKTPEAMKILAEVLPGSDGDPIKGLNVLLAKLKVKKALKDFGMREEDIDRVAKIAVSNPYWNPREIEEGPLRETIRRAWAGEEARADL